jgi:elongation factor 1-gamma
VAKANALDVEVLEVKPQSEEVLKEFPLGKVPGFIGADGLKLHETNAIAIYCKSAVDACKKIAMMSDTIQSFSYP